MNDTLELAAIEKYLRIYGRNKIPFDREDVRLFLKQFSGAILLLVPEAASFMVQNGLDDDSQISYAAMAAIGAALKEIGEQRLLELEEEGRTQ